MQIRKVTAKDIPAVSELAMRLADLERKWDPLIKDPNKQKKGHLEYFLKRFRQRRTQIFVAEDNGIIGFIMGEIQTSPLIYKYKQKGYVHDIYVLKSHRKQGVGQFLLDEMFQWFKEKDVKRVEINAYINNTNAIDFYKRYGFTSLSLTLRKMQ